MKTITFIDNESGDEAVAIVRKAGNSIGLTLSLRSGSDTEVFMQEQTAQELVNALMDIISNE